MAENVNFENRIAEVAEFALNYQDKPEVVKRELQKYSPELIEAVILHLATSLRRCRWELDTCEKQRSGMA